jgi:hypothetical protein
MVKLKGGGVIGLVISDQHPLIIDYVKKEIVMRRIIGYIRWDLKYLPYTFKNGILNLFRWFKVIW